MEDGLKVILRFDPAFDADGAGTVASKPPMWLFYLLFGREFRAFAQFAENTVKPGGRFRVFFGELFRGGACHWRGGWAFWA
jgi:hypothetical protein